MDEATWHQQVNDNGGAVHAKYDVFGHLILYAVFPNEDHLPPAEYAYSIAPASVLLQANTDVAADQADAFITQIQQTWNNYVDNVQGFFTDSIPDAVKHVAQFAGDTAGNVAGAAVEGLWPVLLVVGVGIYVLSKAADTPTGKRVGRVLLRS